MKNYFTDSQVKEALEKLGMRRPFSSHSLQHYKNLMNLAVETAIGEPILFAVPDWEYCLERYSGQTLCAGKNTAIHKLPLYSIKELEN